MINSNLNEVPVRAQTSRGIWRPGPISIVPAVSRSEPDKESVSLRGNNEFLRSLIEPEIRSRISTKTNGRVNTNDFIEVMTNAVLNALYEQPLWANHTLTRRRPNIEEISWILAQSFDWMEDYIIVPFEDIVVVLRMVTIYKLETCALVAAEPVYADGEVCYWLRCSLYEGSENTSLLVGFLRSMASCFEVLDYPDASLIDDLNYSFASQSAIEALANSSERTQTLFLIPKGVTDTRSRKEVRLQMAGALLPFGILGEVGTGLMRDLTGLELPREVCAIALPPPNAQSTSPRIVLEGPVSKDDARLKWAGMADYLGGLTLDEAPWVSDKYKMRRASSAATQYGRLITNRRRCILQPMWLDRKTAAHITSTINKPGWDLYSPLDLDETAIGVESPEADIDGADNDQSSPEEGQENATLLKSLGDGEVPQQPEPDAPALGDLRYPSSLAELPNWAEERLSDGLVIAPRAIREMKKFRHPQPERIAAALELLAGPRLTSFRGERSATNAFLEGLKTLRLRDGFSGAEKLAGRTGDDYIISHGGKVYLLDRHLASNSSGFNDPKMIRIYYFYDPTEDKIVVGWLPTHLQTTKS